MSELDKVNNNLISALEERLEYQKDLTEIYKEYSKELQAQLDSTNKMVNELLEINKTLINLCKPSGILNISK